MLLNMQTKINYFLIIEIKQVINPFTYIIYMHIHNFFTQQILMPNFATNSYANFFMFMTSLIKSPFEEQNCFLD